MRSSTRPVRALSIARLVSLAVAISASASAESRNDYADLALTDEERAKVAKLQTLFKDTRERIGKLYLAADGCKVYRSREENGAVVAWDLVELAQGGYPAFLTGCAGMVVEEWDGYFVFRVCQQAIGASGGCQRGGRFRTRDGLAWECAGGGVSTRSNSGPRPQGTTTWQPCTTP